MSAKPSKVCVGDTEADLTRTLVGVVVATVATTGLRFGGGAGASAAGTTRSPGASGFTGVPMAEDANIAPEARG